MISFRYPYEQTSDVVNLKAGKSYYIEALMSETTGRDHLSIGVQLPDGKIMKPITKNYLSPVRIGRSGGGLFAIVNCTTPICSNLSLTLNPTKFLKALNADFHPDKKIGRAQFSA